MQGPLPGHPSDAPHIPVLIEAILRECAPITGVWLDGTLGAGGYTRDLLTAGGQQPGDGCRSGNQQCDEENEQDDFHTAHHDEGVSQSSRMPVNGQLSGQ